MASALNLTARPASGLASSVTVTGAPDRTTQPGSRPGTPAPAAGPAGGMTPPVAADLEAGVPGSGPVLRFLRHAGVAGGGSGAGPVAALLAEFGAWLAGERGLSPVTVRCYRTHARVFLAGLPEPLDGALQRLDSGAFMRSISLVRRQVTD